MAEINSAGMRKSRSLTKKIIKQSTRTDLTPMVDLGFLLITFFMFVTTLSAPKAMKLRLPADSGKPGTPVAKEKLLTIMADSSGRVYSYEASDPPATFKTHSGNSTESIRRAIQQKNGQVKAAFSTTERAVVNLKFAPACTYNTVMALLDEMKINNVSWYVIDKLRKNDTELIAAQTH
jgi:biopolymer transport protein ExbD